MKEKIDFIALSEIRRRSFTSPFLKKLWAGREFIWHVKEPREDQEKFFLHYYI
jgi:hypothetical protein